LEHTQAGLLSHSDFSSDDDDSVADTVVDLFDVVSLSGSSVVVVSRALLPS
jgi:hypothetical protein